jgi:hypothetical protein
VEFRCGHCGGGSMLIHSVDDEAIRIECLKCGQDTILERDPKSTPPETEARAGLLLADCNIAIAETWHGILDCIEWIQATEPAGARRCSN